MGTESFAARENVRCGVPILRPSMDANVGLCDGNNTRYALGRELVEGVPYNCGTCGLGSFQKGLLDVVKVIQQIRPALLKLQDQVYSECIQSPPLLTDFAQIWPEGRTPIILWANLNATPGLREENMTTLHSMRFTHLHLPVPFPIRVDQATEG